MVTDETREEPRHLAILEFGPEHLARMTSGRFEVVNTGVPEGAKVVRAGYDVSRDAFCLMLEHPSFLPTLPCSPILRLAPLEIRQLPEPIYGDERLLVIVNAPESSAA